MTLPILGIVLLGLLEFSLLFFSRGVVVHASRIGARAASFSGADESGVKSQVRKVLSPRLRRWAQINVQLGDRTGDLVAVAVKVPMTASSPNLLWPIGYDLKSKNLYSETRMVKE